MNKIQPSHANLAQQLKQSEKQKSMLEEELSAAYDALNSTVSGIIITDLNDKVKYVNPAFLRMFEYHDKYEVVGGNSADFFVQKHVQKHVQKLTDVQAIIDKKKKTTVEFEAQRHDGSKFIVEVSTSEITDTEGRRIGQMASFVDRSDREKVRVELKKSKREVRMLASKLLDAQEYERKLVAQELHDSIGSSLSAIKFILEKRLNDMLNKPKINKRIFDDIIEKIQNTIEEVQRISTNLHPSILEHLGILATIRWHCREFEEYYSRFDITYDFQIEEQDIPETLKIVIYRVLQEALNNVVKHSNAKKIFVELKKENRQIMFIISDNGHGFDEDTIQLNPIDHGRMGIESMHERVRHSGGDFLIISKPNVGTKIEGIWQVDQMTEI